MYNNKVRFIRDAGIGTPALGRITGQELTQQLLRGSDRLPAEEDKAVLRRAKGISLKRDINSPVTKGPQTRNKETSGSGWHQAEA